MRRRLATGTTTTEPRHPEGAKWASQMHNLEGWMIRLETLVELRFLNSSFSSLFSLPYSLIELRSGGKHSRSWSLGEHKPGRIKPGRIKRAALSLQNRNYYICWHTFKIHQRGVQWKQGVVIYMMLYTSLLYDTTPIHCTPLPLHPPCNEYPYMGVAGFYDFTLRLEKFLATVDLLRLP